MSTIPPTVPPPSARTERILALLDKAESTPYEHEAEAFMAKAQELMAREAITEAMLEASRRGADPGEVVHERFTIVAPYARAKLTLLGAVAAVNRCRVVTQTAASGAQLTTIVGHETDVAHVRTLYLSLSHQAVRFLRTAPVPPHETPRRFRQSFLLAYAHRIGERLQEAAASATSEAEQEQMASGTGRSVSLVLANRSAKVDRAFAEAYPSTRTTRVTGSSGAGFVSGRAAAERAALGQRGLDERRRPLGPGTSG